jgi:hypothetical protein
MGVLGHLVFANSGDLESLLLPTKKLYLSFCLRKDDTTGIGLMSVPESRDAPCDETNHRYSIDSKFVNLLKDLCIFVSVILFNYS